MFNHRPLFLPPSLGESSTGSGGGFSAGLRGAQALARQLSAEAWLVEPVVVVRRHPTGGWTHAVKQSEPGVRLYRGWWPCRHEAAQALTPHVARTGRMAALAA
jgi:hypothetical protein